MFKHKIIQKLILALFFFSSALSIKSQTCPPPSGNWNSVINGLYEGMPSYKVYCGADYNFRTNGSVTDIKVDWSTLHPYYSRPGFTTEELKDLERAAIMFRLAGDCYNSNGANLTFKFYETVNCETEKTCYLELDQTLQYVCKDDAFPANLVPIYPSGNQFYYPYKSISVCGTVCCITTYVVKCAFNVTHSVDRLVLQSKTVNSETCPTSTNVNCLTNEVVPCNSKCQ